VLPDRIAIMKAAEKRRELVTALLVDLIRLDTSTPPGNERLAAEYVARFCDQRKIRYRRHDAGEGHVSLIGHVGKGGSPRLFVPAHTDVVPAGDGWTVDPFGGVIKKGAVWGRGTTDNKGALAGLLAAADYLNTVPHLLRGTYQFGAIADEETGSQRGLIWLIKKGLIKATWRWFPISRPPFGGDIAGRACWFPRDVSGEAGALQQTAGWRFRPGRAGGAALQDREVDSARQPDSESLLSATTASRPWLRRVWRTMSFRPKPPPSTHPVPAEPERRRHCQGALRTARQVASRRPGIR